MSDHDLVYSEAFEADREGYWGCSCGASGEVHIGSTCRPVKVATRVRMNHRKHATKARAA